MITLFVINIIKVIWEYPCAADWRLVPTLSIFFGSVNEKDGEAGEEVALRAKPGFILRWYTDTRTNNYTRTLYSCCRDTYVHIGCNLVRMKRLEKKLQQ